MDGTQTAPLGTISRETNAVTKTGAENVTTHELARKVYVAVGAGKIQLTPFGPEKPLALVVAFACSLLGKVDADTLAVGKGFQVGRNLCHLAFFKVLDGF